MNIAIGINSHAEGINSSITKVNNVYLGEHKLSDKEIKYIEDTKFWNYIKNLDILKELEKELKKF